MKHMFCGIQQTYVQIGCVTLATYSTSLFLKPVFAQTGLASVGFQGSMPL